MVCIDVFVFIDEKKSKKNDYVHTKIFTLKPTYQYIGRDSTDVILAYHPDWVIQKKMTHFYIGELDPCASTRTSAISKSYRNLDARIRQLGYYDTDYWFYIREGIKFLALWIGVVYFAVVGAGSVGYVLTSALLCAFLWHQGVFVAHDGKRKKQRWSPQMAGLYSFLYGFIAFYISV